MIKHLSCYFQKLLLIVFIGPPAAISNWNGFGICKDQKSYFDLYSVITITFLLRDGYINHGLLVAIYDSW